ncbi:MAG: hypothetical protein NVS9B4_03140 [Candidatus Acidiferrum sp.]
MRRYISLRLALAVLAIPVAHAVAANQDSSSSASMADAARHAREQSKNSTKPAKVITDDDLDAKKQVKPGQQGLTVDSTPKLETQPPSAEDVAAAKADEAAAKATDAKDTAEIKSLKELVAQAEKDLDLAKRALALQQDTYLSNPDHEHDVAGKATLDEMQQSINEKQEQVERLKTRLDALLKKHPEKSPAPPTQSDRSP